jgi:hypothetical protein
VNAPLRPIRIAGMADWLHPQSYVHKALALLKAYCDESWTGGVTAIAGYVASKPVWEAVEGAWQNVLTPYADKGVKTFHAAHCCGAEGYGEFALVDTFHRMAILTSLSGILRDANVQAVWSAIYTEDWDQTVTDREFLAAFPKPFHLCFEHIVRQLAAWARKNANGERVCPVFSRQPEFEEWMTYASQSYGQAAWYQETLGPIAFGYPWQVVPLQCADLIAHEISWEWERRGYGPPPTLQTIGYRRLLANASAYNGLHVGGCFDANALRLAVERFKKTGRII